MLDRLGLLIRADAHGVMDRLEEKTLLVRQHLRDAELALEHERVRVASIDEELEGLREAVPRAEARLADLDADVDLALGRGEEELARFTVRRLLPEREALRRLKERAEELGARRQRLAARLREREAAFESLRARARDRLAELAHEAPESERTVPAVAEEDVDLELLRRRGAGGARGGEVSA
jgi:phage shock protein A